VSRRSRREAEPEPEPEPEPRRRRGAIVSLLDLATRPVRRAWASPDPLDDYALVHATHVMGDTLFVVALADSVFFSLPVGESRTKVALYLLLTVAPLALAAPLLVKLLDKAGPRRMISFGAAAGRAALAIYLAPRVGTMVLFPVAFLMLAMSKAHGIAKNGLTVAYAPTEEGLVKANARLGRWAVVGAVVMAGPAVAVLKLSGSTAVLYCAAAVYLLSGLLNGRLPHPRVPEGSAEVGRRGRVPELRVAAFGAGSLRAAAGFLIFLLAFALRAEDQPPYWYGVLAGAAAAGGFLGDVIAPRAPKRLREEGLLFVAVALAAAAAVAAFELYGLAALAVFCATVGMSTEFGRLGFQALMQRLVPVNAHGRVFVRYEVAFQLAWVAGAFVPAMFPITFRGGVLLMGVFYAVTGVVYLALPRLSAMRSGGAAGSTRDPR
jgi:hypothetical protein